MRNRWQRRALNIAQRGELFHGVPLGYVLLPNGEVALDPDEQAQSVVQLIFDKFDELGTIYAVFQYLVRHDIPLPIRPRGGPNKGELKWRRPTLITVSDVLHRPIYAGAYAYGRRVCDRKSPGKGRRPYKQVWKPMDKWKVLIKDRLPASTSWDRYLRNQERIVQNRSGYDKRGTSRDGCALLTGLLVCGNCGRRMQVDYRHDHQPHYSCVRHLMEGTEQQCWGLVDTTKTPRPVSAGWKFGLQLVINADC